MSSTVCGWCGRLTHMTLASKLHRLSEDEDRYGHSPFAAAFQCDNEECKGLSIGRADLYLGNGSTQEVLSRNIATADLKWTPSQVLRPKFPDVPEQIAATASEAHACLSIHAYRGAVALARAVVEATAKDKGIVKGPLVNKIDELSKAGHIREITRQLAHEIREGGNEIAHGDLADESMPPQDAEAIVSLMDEILQEVYQGPAKMLRLKKNREEREQRNSEKKVGS
ncbi:DUF4145 domain-containing protein [Streptomyces tauricus]|uniref:DUF4145 domain-containing protein n=1 Tax=Streptomyces tauricus TaxID=68274 RepID=UPI00343CB46B